MSGSPHEASGRTPGQGDDPDAPATGDERSPETLTPPDLELDLDLPHELAARLQRAAAGAASWAGSGAAPPAAGPAGAPAERASETSAPANPAGPVDPLAALQAEVAAARAEAATHRDKWLRAMAELENFRKRARREMETSILLANAKVLRELLDVLDNFERAFAATPAATEGAGETLSQGVRLIYERFREILRQNGVVRIEAENAAFDPNLHEAISQVEREGVPSHQVVEIAQAGYMLGDVVLRPARVVVAK